MSLLSDGEKAVVLTEIDTGFGVRKVQLTCYSGGYVQGNTPGTDPVYFIHTTYEQLLQLQFDIANKLLEIATREGKVT